MENQNLIIKRRDRVLNVLTGGLFISGFLTISWTTYMSWTIKRDSRTAPQMECISKSEIREMETREMDLTLPKGERFKIWWGYYRCNPVNRGDLVFYKYQNQAPPTVRIVRGLPGDQISLMQLSPGLWQLQVNNKTILGPEEKPFQLTDILSPLPLNSLFPSSNNTLKPTEYWLMTIVPPGSLDSLHLGPAPHSHIVGKVIPLLPSY